MGVNFIKGKIGKITEKDNGNLFLRYEDINENKLKESEHDMVILSVGVLSNPDNALFFNGDKLWLDQLGYINQPEPLSSPAETTVKGVYVAGSAAGPMDIPDSILSAGAASAAAISYIIEAK